MKARPARQEEVRLYSPDLASRRVVVVANKVDQVADLNAALAQLSGGCGEAVIGVSALLGHNIEALKQQLRRMAVEHV